MNREAWDAARAAARRTGGYITSLVLLHCGVDRWAARRAVQSGVLIRRYPGVYGFAPEPMQPALRAWAPILACGERAALHERSALAVYGLRRSWPTPVHVIAPRRHHLHDTHVLHAPWLIAGDIWTVETVPTLSPALTILYTTERFTTEARLLRAINTLRLGHGLKTEDLAAALYRFPRHPNARRLRVTVPTLTPNPTRSGNEDLWTAVARAHGLPPYEMNIDVAGHLVDVFFRDPGLIVEIDGEQHDIEQRIDAARDAAILAATGIPTLRIPDTELRKQPTATAARVQTAIESLRANAQAAGSSPRTAGK